MKKENLSIMLHPIDVTKAFFDLTKEVLDFEPRPGSDKGSEPKVTVGSVLERAKERTESRKVK
jgi:hypothetical protein